VTGRSDDELVLDDDDVVDAELVEETPATNGSDDDLFGIDATDPLDSADLSPEQQQELLLVMDELRRERDDYLDLAKRVQAEFENYKRRVETQRTEQAARAAEQLVVELLPVLDACEAAIAHGATDVEPIHAALFGTLSKLGLSVVADNEVVFDPNVHEAVLSEPGDDEAPVVAEVMRPGFLWNGRVVRPAMVKVRG
jgi:molecular chaperone GrpE